MSSNHGARAGQDADAAMTLQKGRMVMCACVCVCVRCGVPGSGSLLTRALPERSIGDQQSGQNASLIV